MSRFVNTLASEKGLSFNGSSEGATVPVTPATDGFSFGMWIYKNAVPVSGTRFVDYTDGGPAKGFDIGIHSNLKSYVLNMRDAAGSVAAITSPVVPVGMWVHLVVTYVVDSAKLYINTTSIGTDTSCTMAAPTQSLTLAKRSSAGSNYANIIIKNFTFQNTTTAWTQDQINDLYYRNIIPTGAQQWSMNDTANDNTGGNALTLTGTSYTTNVPSQYTTRSTSGTRIQPGLYGAIKNLPSLVAYYPLNETSGSAINNCTSTFGSYNGTVSGATQNQSGLVGSCYTFDGNDSVICSGLVLPASWSIGVLAKRNGAAGNGEIVNCLDNGPKNGITISRAVTSGNTVANVWGASAPEGSVTDTSVTDDTWYFYVATYTTNSYKFYKNGSQLGSTDTSVSITPSTQSLTIGRNSRSATNFYTGSIQHVFMTSGVLTDSKIKELYLLAVSSNALGRTAA